MFRDPDGNTWLLQEITTRLPGRVDATTTTSFASVKRPGRRAPSGGGRPWQDEKRTGERDAN